MADELPPDEQQAVNDYLAWHHALRTKFTERFGTLYAWLFDDPEIGPIFQTAAEQEWDPNLLEARLRSSNWWRSRTDAQRKWVALEQTDSGEAVRRVNDQKFKIHQLAQMLGVELGDEDAGGIAWTALREGLNEQQIRSIVASRGPAGDGTRVNTDVRGLARSYMVDLDDETIDRLTRQVFSGVLNEDGLRSMLVAKASAKFPSMAEQIKAGITPEDFFADYRTMISRMTDTPAAQVDLMRDPEWSRVLSTTDAKTGQVRPMSLPEAQSYVRRSDRYGQSNTGRREMAEFTSTLTQILGTRKAG